MYCARTGTTGSTRLEYVCSSLTASKGQRRRHTVHHCTGTLLWYLLQLVFRSHHVVVASLCECAGDRNLFLRHIYIFRKRDEGTPTESQNPEGAADMRQKRELVYPKESNESSSIVR
jgi:hypothetical protein